MALQSGILKFEGNIGDLNFAKINDVYIVRRKATIAKERIMTDPKFLRTRQNMDEFANVSKGSSKLRKSLKAAISTVKDGTAHTRLVRVLADIKNLDVINERGFRTVAIGISGLAGQAILDGFEFNRNTSLGSLLFKDFILDTDSGILTISGLKPSTDLLKPQAANKAGFNLFWSKVDFANGVYNTVQATESLISLDDSSYNLTLTIPTPPTGIGVNVFVMRLVFYQTINGKDYILNDVSRVAAKIIAVV